MIMSNLYILEQDIDAWILIGDPSKKHPSVHCKRYVAIFNTAHSIFHGHKLRGESGVIMSNLYILEQDIDTWILIGDPSRKHPSVHCKRYVAIFNTAHSIFHGHRLRGESGVIMSNLYILEQDIDTWILIGDPSRKHPSVHCKRNVAIFNTAHSIFHGHRLRGESGVIMSNLYILEQDIDTWILIGDPSRKHPSVHCKRYVAIFNTAHSIFHGHRLRGESGVIMSNLYILEQDIDTWILIGDPSRKHPSVHCKRYVAIFNKAHSIFHGHRLRGESGVIMSNLYILEQDIDTWILIGDPSRKHPSVHCKRYVAIFNTAHSIFHGHRLRGESSVIMSNLYILEQDIDTWILIGDPSRKHPSVHCKRYVAIFNTAHSIFHGHRLRGESGVIMSILYSGQDIETWILIGDPSRKHPSVHCKRYVAIFNTAHSIFHGHRLRGESGVIMSNLYILEQDIDTWILIGDPSRKYPSVHCKRYVAIFNTAHSILHGHRLRVESGVIMSNLYILEQDIDTWILIGDQNRKHPSVHCKRYVAIFNTAHSIFHGHRLRGESGVIMSNLYILEQDIDTWILIGDPSRKHPSVHCKRYVAIFNTAHSIFHGHRLRGESGVIMSNPLYSGTRH